MIGDCQLKIGSSLAPLKHVDFKGASGVIKFLTGSCLSGLGIVLKDPSEI